MDILDLYFEMFPRLSERREQLAGTLRGVEQQMLALAQGNMSKPKIMLIDEPSVGLAPIFVSMIIEKIKEMQEKSRLTVLMREQNFNQAIKIADRGYIIVEGKAEFEGNVDELSENEMVKKLYRGI